MGMLHYPSSKISRGLRHFGIVVGRIVKEILALVPEAHVDVHARAVVKCNWLWHHSRYHVVLLCDVLYDILATLNRVARVHKVIIPDVDFTLAGRRDLMMVRIAYYAKVVCKSMDALISVLHQRVTRCAWQVPFLEPERVPYAISRPRGLS